MKFVSLIGDEQQHLNPEYPVKLDHFRRLATIVVPTISADSEPIQKAGRNWLFLA